LAIFIGALVSLGYILLMVVRRNYTMFAAIPYGPFLIAGAVAILYF
jgi:prepilin signal peptidase PulO-like enzyme (type II secretory pathway)